MIKLNGHLIVPTIFPDKTSQVWKIEKRVLEHVEKSMTCEVLWEFESEAELVHVAQLKMLLSGYSEYVDLVMPYLPYARQDKHVANDVTFALRTFATMLNSLRFNRVRVIDAHSHWASYLIEGFEDDFKVSYVTKAYDSCGANMVVFPDAGAKERYGAYNIGPSVYAEKKRDQSTGEITGLTIYGKFKGKKLMIVDDLCDGGRTFIEIAKLLILGGAKKVHLYVTHGIFSKGLDVLTDAGIKRIFTYKGEVNA